MGAFVKGDVIVASFPFSDLTAAKKRPALVVATLTGDDVILFQITSQAVADSYALPLADRDCTSGGLRQACIFALIASLPVTAASLIGGNDRPHEKAGGARETGPDPHDLSRQQPIQQNA